MATATDEETGNIISNTLPGQERGDVAFVGAEEHGQSTSNIKNSEGNLSAQSPQNIEGTEDGMSAASIKSNENNALALTEKAPAEELRTKCGYNTGHGDFCFGRYVDRNDEVWEKYDLDDTVWNEKDWIEGSNGVPNSIGPIERNRLERAGSFPFFKLPKDIRQKIFGFMVAPLNAHHQPCTRIHLEHSTRKGSLIWPEEIYGQQADDLAEAQLLEPLPGSDGEQSKAREIEKRKRHPDRKSPYKFVGTALRYGKKGDKWLGTKDWLYIEWIRQASNVSTRFRLELGNALWSDIELWVGGERAEFWLLPEFLEERPAAGQGIKELHLDLLFMLYNRENPLVDEHHNFEAWCESLAKHCKPDIIYITLSLYVHDLKDIGKEEGHFATLPASRKLVTKDFRLRVYVYHWGSEDETFPTWQDEYAAECKLVDEYAPILREIMLPNCLRKVGPETKVDKALEGQLESRL